MNARAKIWAWRLAKGLLAAAILLGVGRQFYHDLSKPAAPDEPDLGALPWRPAWLAASGGLYLSALSLSACYWYRLLKVFGAPPNLRQSVSRLFHRPTGQIRAGQGLGVALARRPGRGPGRSVGDGDHHRFLRGFNHDGGGRILAAVVFIIAPPEIPDLRWHPLFTRTAAAGLVRRAPVARRVQLLDTAAEPALCPHRCLGTTEDSSNDVGRGNSY